jgi:hypothetical protein
MAQHYFNRSKNSRSPPLITSTSDRLSTKTTIAPNSTNQRSPLHQKPAIALLLRNQRSPLHSHKPTISTSHSLIPAIAPSLHHIQNKLRSLNQNRLLIHHHQINSLVLNVDALLGEFRCNLPKLDWQLIGQQIDQGNGTQLHRLLVRQGYYEASPNLAR